MSPLSYAPLRADAGAGADDDDTSTSPPETLTVSTVAAAAVGVGHHLLKVEGYSRLKRMHGDDTGNSYIESGEFTAGGHTWRVLCYLNGYPEEEGAGHVSLYLQCGAAAAAAGSGVVHAEFEFELVRHHGTRWPSSGALIRSPAVPFEVGGRKWGYAKFIAAEKLERSGLLEDDCFAVRCTVTVVDERGAVEGNVTAEDMDRVGVVCPCKDGSCQFKHERPAETLWEKIALICRFICGEASS
ncbi:unnamed protein product [Urochloa decumbens]|uniref:MATH domain-containing protein n=1 Tax=Urochloa decumbens TaxID=240449 RepID=A0ABC9GE22_9POAL